MDMTADGPRPNEASSIVKYWLSELDAAKRREKDYRKDGQRILDIYNGDKNREVVFNILYSNTETLLPALYSAIPRPVVQRRHKSEDIVGKEASAAGQRVLEYFLDTNVDGYETFDEAMRAATLDALLPGRGVTVVKYDAEVSEDPTSDGADEPMSYTSGELVCLDTKAWNRVYFGYAKKWSKVPWVAYEEYVDKKEATRLFGKEKAGKIVYTSQDNNDREEDARSSADDRNRGERKTACIYQIWDKDGGRDGTRKVRYISGQYTEGYLKVEDDPLGLTGFFNCPRPLRFIEKSHDLLPTALYTIYENQANELNRLTVRINRIVEAIKARGIYDSELGEELGNLMKADDNALVPADKSSSLAAEKGLQNAIWFMPVEQLVSTLMQLYAAREQSKQVIYEITGISDILRGASQASETATAQNIKAQWGTLRLKRLQREVQRYARDVMRMMLEIAATKLSEESWAKITGLPFMTSTQQQQAKMLAQAAQMSGQPLDPAMMQQLQQPAWPDILGVLRDDIQRSYRVDIETNSTVEPEAVEDQKNISELMMAIGQFLTGVGPLVAKKVLPFEIAQTMLLTITRRFRFGPEIEDQIKRMQEPPEEQNTDGQADQAKMQMEMQIAQARMQMEGQLAQATEQRIQQAEVAKHQRETQAEQYRQQMETAKLQLMQQIELAKLEAAKQAGLAERQAERHTAQMQAQMQQETELRKAEIQMQTQIAIAKIKADSTRDASMLAEGT